ncbi:hypothetical protein [uncultured Psychromonas sp.]|uniref:hypothetical protein n=1 Tax=uncultured Psychromonas sp. TaxID=173974 RepID=UPI0026358077|nr:hypothetical protein [uncultured Psychromonas sp.]
MKWYQLLSVALLSSVLFACGGGSDGGLSFNDSSSDSTDSTDDTDDSTDSTDSTDDSTDSDDAEEVTLSVSLFTCPTEWDSESDDISLCTETTEISESEPGYIAVSLSLDGEVVTGEREALYASTTTGKFEIDSNLTDESTGIAYFKLNADDQLGVGIVTFTSDAYDGTLSTTLTFLSVSEPVDTDELQLTASLFICPNGWDNNSSDLSVCETTTEIDESDTAIISVTLYLEGEAVVGSRQAIYTETTKGSFKVDSALTDEATGTAYFELNIDDDLGVGIATITTDAFGGDASTEVTFEVIESDEVVVEDEEVELSALLYSCPSNWSKNDGTDSCATVSNFSAVEEGVVSVTLTQGGEAVTDNQQIITASTTLGEFSTSTALTNTDGIAYFTISASDAVGAGRITVTTDAFDEETSTTLNFEIVEADFAMTIENILNDELLAQSSTTLITVNLTLDGEAYNTPVNVSFSSICAVAGTSSLDDTVTTTNGIAQATYQAEGCVGEDTITASIDINDLSMSTTINIASSDADSIRFISATPTDIAIAGTGGAGRQETSTVLFEVVDVNGVASSLQDVTFSLEIAPVGTTLDSETGTTDDDGEVSVVVKSGKIAGTVRVKIEIDNDESVISSISDQLSVSTGLPDQDSFSFALEDHSPESFNINGVTINASVLLADRFNNAVPDGTTIFFNTEGGAIRDTETGTTGACTTSGSGCSVEWVSQNPRPEGNKLTDFNIDGQCGYFEFAPSDKNNTGPCINTDDVPVKSGMGQPHGGRVTITAYTEGEENFIDNDGDGWFNLTKGDAFVLSTDVGEVFFDYNEDGLYTKDEEEYRDIDGSRDYTSTIENPIYNGLLCSDESEALADCSKGLVHVRDQQILIMASTDQYIRVQHDSTDIGEVDLAPNDEDTDEDIIIESYNVTAYFADIYNNRPPTGTTINVSTENGQLSGQTSWVVGSSVDFGAYEIEFTLIQEDSPNDKTFGTLSIELVTPEGGSLTFQMNVRDAG